jgi:hypothetical protein
MVNLSFGGVNGLTDGFNWYTQIPCSPIAHHANARMKSNG